MSSSEKLASALFECIVNTPECERNELFAMLKEWRTKYARSYSAVKKQPAAKNLIEAMEEAEIACREFSA